MKKLVILAWVFFTAVIIIATAFALILIFRPLLLALFAFLLFALGTTAILLLIESHKKLSAARAIIDSAVIHIQPATIVTESEEEKKAAERLKGDFGIYVSSFGILIGSKVIRFNQNGIWLRKVEIGSDYIAFTYGERDGELQNIRLLYSKPNEDELTKVIENFRKDTGVIPFIAT